ncbi:hypothetical protein CDL12_11077 [Handroanthus impetiginosus]|uniref:Uncharacterized protein n=1 Tax=Handroanthus impetiginosus TaxID=429701 RepID=A0A2G9HFG6_9LAMI|nr:hypothetical protein CDL12_11077 [Handroanthus impetiginosus]
MWHSYTSPFMKQELSCDQMSDIDNLGNSSTLLQYNFDGFGESFPDTTQEHMVSFFEHATEARRSSAKHLIECSTWTKASFNAHPTRDDAIISEVGKVFSVSCVNDEMSERDICISFLRNLGLLDKFWIRQERASPKNTVISSDYFYEKPCKVCEHLDSSSNMLLYDSCDAAFHGGLGSFKFMFQDIEPYMSNVRIGDEFQAKNSHWSGLIYNDSNLIVDQLEMDPSNSVSMQKFTKSLKVNFIGAPLFELQTGGWECFYCVPWDPSHADCVELDTKEVMKQLKYIDMVHMTNTVSLFSLCARVISKVNKLNIKHDGRRS